MEVAVLRGNPERSSGDGYGDGYGYGYGSGYDLVRCTPVASVVTKDDLRAKNACAGQFRVFLKTFPDGCNWPADAIKARDAGLDVAWARTHLGLLFPVSEPGDRSERRER